MELKLIKAELSAMGKGWYKLTIETNLKTLELYLKPRIEIKTDNPITIGSMIGDTLTAVGDIWTASNYDI